MVRVIGEAHGAREELTDPDVVERAFVRVRDGRHFERTAPGRGVDDDVGVGGEVRRAPPRDPRGSKRVRHPLGELAPVDAQHGPVHARQRRRREPRRVQVALDAAPGDGAARGVRVRAVVDVGVEVEAARRGPHAGRGPDDAKRGDVRVVSRSRRRRRRVRSLDDRHAHGHVDVSTTRPGLSRDAHRELVRPPGRQRTRREHHPGFAEVVRAGRLILRQVAALGIDLIRPRARRREELARPHVRERKRDALRVPGVVRVLRRHLQREGRVGEDGPVVPGEQIRDDRGAGHTHGDDLIAEKRPGVDAQGAPQSPLVHRVGFQRARRDVQRSRGQRARVDVEVVCALEVLLHQNRPLHDGPAVVDAVANLRRCCGVASHRGQLNVPLDGDGVRTRGRVRPPARDHRDGHGVNGLGHRRGSRRHPAGEIRDFHRERVAHAGLEVRGLERDDRIRHAAASRLRGAHGGAEGVRHRASIGGRGDHGVTKLHGPTAAASRLRRVQNDAVARTDPVRDAEPRLGRRRHGGGADDVAPGRGVRVTVGVLDHVLRERDGITRANRGVGAKVNRQRLRIRPHALGAGADVRDGVGGEVPRAPDVRDVRAGAAVGRDVKRRVYSHQRRGDSRRGDLGRFGWGNLQLERRRRDERAAQRRAHPVRSRVGDGVRRGELTDLARGFCQDALRDLRREGLVRIDGHRDPVGGIGRHRVVVGVADVHGERLRDAGFAAVEAPRAAERHPVLIRLARSHRDFKIVQQRQTRALVGNLQRVIARGVRGESRGVRPVGVGDDGGGLDGDGLVGFVRDVQREPLVAVVVKVAERVPGFDDKLENLATHAHVLANVERRVERGGQRENLRMTNLDDGTARRGDLDAPQRRHELVGARDGGNKVQVVGAVFVVHRRPGHLANDRVDVVGVGTHRPQPTRVRLGADRVGVSHAVAVRIHARQPHGGVGPGRHGTFLRTLVDRLGHRRVGRVRARRSHENAHVPGVDVPDGRPVTPQPRVRPAGSGGRVLHQDAVLAGECRDEFKRHPALRRERHTRRRDPGAGEDAGAKVIGGGRGTRGAVFVPRLQQQSRCFPRAKPEFVGDVRLERLEVPVQRDGCKRAQRRLLGDEHDFTRRVHLRAVRGDHHLDVVRLGVLGGRVIDGVHAVADVHGRLRHSEIGRDGTAECGEDARVLHVAGGCRRVRVTLGVGGAHVDDVGLRPCRHLDARAVHQRLGQSRKPGIDDGLPRRAGVRVEEGLAAARDERDRQPASLGAREVDGERAGLVVELGGVVRHRVFRVVAIRQHQFESPIRQVGRDPSLIPGGVVERQREIRLFRRAGGVRTRVGGQDAVDARLGEVQLPRHD